MSTAKGTMGTIRATNLQDKIFNIERMTTGDWEQFKRSVDKQIMDSYYRDKAELYKQNYLISLERTYGRMGEQLYKRMSEIPADTLVEMYYNDPVLQLDFNYDPHEIMIKINAINQHLDNYDNLKREIDAYDSVADDMEYDFEDMDY